MTVHFIGVGPGAPDLLTIRGKNIIAQSPICLYAGSLIPEEILQYCNEGTEIINSAPLDLEKIVEIFIRANNANKDISRLHSGDLSIWSAMGEQIRALKQRNIDFSVTPGVPSFAAAAASLGCELTLPGISQTLVLTRTDGRATAMPKDENLEDFAKTNSTLAIHLSIQNLESVVSKLIPYYGQKCPVSVVYRASWPDQQILTGHLENIDSLVPSNVDRTAIILVGWALNSDNFRTSRLYDPTYDRRFRPQNNKMDGGIL